MSVTIKKYWKDIHEVNQSGSVRKWGEQGRVHSHKGGKKGFYCITFYVSLGFLNHMGVSIQKLKTLIIIKDGLRQKAFSALIPCHVAMVTSYFFLGCLEQGGSSH